MHFFDLGVALYPKGFGPVELKSKDNGDSMEHWIMHELKTWMDYNAYDADLNYGRTSTGIEVDFVIDNAWQLR